ncbi:hypothetical protein PUN28_012105 [Cardiocondyla obscurior]|uniref:Uncharacterized protein n=1 Tax=Cardiocondyla obscurior TaxID=286306 RepID=A0AAW2FCR8_9HYME
MNPTEAETVADLVQNMVISLCGEQKSESIRRFMRFSLGLLSSTQGIETLREDEMTVATYIKSKLPPRDAVQFDKLHNDLKDAPMKNRISILIFLLNMGQAVEQMKDRIFSFPEMKLELSPITSTSGKIK